MSMEVGIHRWWEEKLQLLTPQSPNESSIKFHSHNKEIPCPIILFRFLAFDLTRRVLIICRLRWWTGRRICPLFIATLNQERKVLDEMAARMNPEMLAFEEAKIFTPSNPPPPPPHQSILYIMYLLQTGSKELYKAPQKCWMNVKKSMHTCLPRGSWWEDTVYIQTVKSSEGTCPPVPRKMHLHKYHNINWVKNSDSIRAKFKRLQLPGLADSIYSCLISPKPCGH